MFELAICDFRLNLEKLRELYPVKTICMHGSPLSKWDKKIDKETWGTLCCESYYVVGFRF